MHKVGLLGAIELGNFGNCSRGTDEPVPAPPPTDRAQGETFVADLIAMRAHACRDHNIEAGRPGSARRR
jgi:hypothetical protein